MYKILNNYLGTPKKIYDGAEPKKIEYILKDNENSDICKIDLWNANGIYNYSKNKSEFDEINQVLCLKKKKSGSIDMEALYTDKVDGKDRIVYFIKCEKNPNYVIAYTLSEIQPMRYQCYVLAEIDKI